MGSKLFVGNLSFGTTDDGLRRAFPGATSVKVITDRETGRSRGFGFVEFGTSEEAVAATQEWDGRDLDGRAIRVNEAEDKPARGRGPAPGHGASGHGAPGGEGGHGGAKAGRRKGSRRRRGDDYGGYD